MHLFVQCKVQTAFVSLFYIFINMKPWNASNSSVVVGKPRPLRHLTNFFTNFYEFLLISENSLKFAIFFAEVTNGPSVSSRNSESVGVGRAQTTASQSSARYEGVSPRSDLKTNTASLKTTRAPNPLGRLRRYFRPVLVGWRGDL